jgi:hypothetical protein
MSEHTVYTAAVRQIAGLVAERDALLEQVAGLVEEREVLRTGLRAVKIICAGLSMTDANFGRAELARVESYIEGVLERGSTPVPPENAQLRAALAAVEFADYEGRCPWCMALQGNRHNIGCERQRALGIQEVGA